MLNGGVVIWFSVLAGGMAVMFLGLAVLLAVALRGSDSGDRYKILLGLAAVLAAVRCPTVPGRQVARYRELR